MDVIPSPPLEPPPARRRRVNAWLKATALLLVSLLVELEISSARPSRDDPPAAESGQEYTWRRLAQIAIFVILIVGVAIVEIVKIRFYWRATLLAQ